jgi:hypothetical protein
VLKSLHRPLAQKSPIIQRELHLVSGIQCLPSMKVSSSVGISAFHHITSLACF